MKKQIFLSIILSSFIFLITGCVNSKKLSTTKLTVIRSDSTKTELKVELAKTYEERAIGYMNRKNIPDGTGMIFIFEKDQILSFWMKNTPHPLSIAYIDSTGKIRDIFDMKPYSLDSIISTVSTRYALEVPQGWFEKNNINVGDRIELDF